VGLINLLLGHRPPVGTGRVGGEKNSWSTFGRSPVKTPGVGRKLEKVVRKWRVAGGTWATRRAFYGEEGEGAEKKKKSAVGKGGGRKRKRGLRAGRVKLEEKPLKGRGNGKGAGRLVERGFVGEMPGGGTKS